MSTCQTRSTIGNAAPHYRATSRSGKYFERAFEQVAATAHLLSNVDVDDRRRTARHCLQPGDRLPLAVRRAIRSRPADFVLLGSYDDELVRTPDGWRIAHRVVGAKSTSGPTGLAAGAAARESSLGFGRQSWASVSKTLALP